MFLSLRSLVLRSPVPTEYSHDRQGKKNAPIVNSLMALSSSVKASLYIRRRTDPVIAFWCFSPGS